jgi:hypothetical protein
MNNTATASMDGLIANPESTENSSTTTSQSLWPSPGAGASTRTAPASPSPLGWMKQPESDDHFRTGGNPDATEPSAVVQIVTITNVVAEDNAGTRDDDAMLERVVEYLTAKMHSYEDFPFDFGEDCMLDRWVSRQRNAFKMGELAADRIRRFQAAGLALDDADAEWFHRWERLKYYKHQELLGTGEEEATGTSILDVEEQDPDLANWVKSQRLLYEQHELPRVRHSKLRDVGFAWEGGSLFNVEPTDETSPSSGTTAPRGVSPLGELFDMKSNCEDPDHAGDKTESENSVSPSAKKESYKSSLEDALAKVEASKNIGEFWKQMFRRLIVHMKQNQLRRIPYALVGADRNLRKWLSNQRTQHWASSDLRKKPVTWECYAILESLGFVWKRKHMKAQEGHCSVESELEHSEAEEDHMEDEYSLPPLPRMKRRLLSLDDALAKVDASEVITVPWKRMFRHLIVYMKRNQLHRIPYYAPGGADRDLGRWLSNQRTRSLWISSDSTMRPDRQERHAILDSLGFVWNREDREKEGNSNMNSTPRKYFDKESRRGILRAEDDHIEDDYSLLPPTKKKRTKSSLEDTMAKVEASEGMTESWKQMFRRLIVYMKQNQLHRIPYSPVGADTDLQKWLSNQRTNKLAGSSALRKKPEIQECHAILDALGFVWNREDLDKQHGHCNMNAAPRKHFDMEFRLETPEAEEDHIGDKYSLPPPTKKKRTLCSLKEALAKVEASEGIGEFWKQMFRRLIVYMKQNQLQRIPFFAVGADRDLQNWLSHQRSYHRLSDRRKKPVTLECYAVLDSLGFVWKREHNEGTDGNCSMNTPRREFLDVESRLESPEAKVDHIEDEYSLPPLPRTKRSLLGLDIALAKVEESEVIPLSWKQMFRRLIVYMKQNQLHRIPYAAEGADRDLRKWLSNQRIKSRWISSDLTKSPDRQERHGILDSLGFVWNREDMEDHECRYNMNSAPRDFFDMKSRSETPQTKEDLIEDEHSLPPMNQRTEPSLEDTMAKVEASKGITESWKQMFRRLIVYMKQNQLHRIPYSPVGADTDLQKWLSNQRTNKRSCSSALRKKTETQECHAILDTLGFVWNREDMEGQEGNSSNYNMNDKSASYCRTPTSRKRNFEDTQGTTPTWASIPTAWMEMYNRLVDYMDNRMLSRLPYELDCADSDLVEWFRNQRRGYVFALAGKPQFTKSFHAQVALLNSIGFIWSSNGTKNTTMRRNHERSTGLSTEKTDDVLDEGREKAARNKDSKVYNEHFVLTDIERHAKCPTLVSELSDSGKPSLDVYGIGIVWDTGDVADGFRFVEEQEDAVNDEDAEVYRHFLLNDEKRHEIQIMERNHSDSGWDESKAVTYVEFHEHGDRIGESTVTSWHDSFNLLLEYMAEQKIRTIVFPFRPREENLELGLWLDGQRNLYWHGKLPQKNIDLLDRIGMVWDTGELKSNVRLDEEKEEAKVEIDHVAGTNMAQLPKKKRTAWQGTTWEPFPTQPTRT